MEHRPFRGIVRKTGPGLAIQEVLYGFIMALIYVTAARIGVLSYTDTTNLVILIIGMNFTWGLIDAVVFYIVDVFDQTKFIRIMSACNLPHEKKVAEHFGKEIAYPYLDKDLVAILRSAPTEAIRPVDQDVRKKLLSDAARDLGLGYLADRPKKAAQYGSGMMDAVKRICRKRGITYNKLVADLRKEMDGYSRM